MKFIPVLESLRDRDNVTKKTAGFAQQKKNLYSMKCPKIKVKFGYKNKSTGIVEAVECGTESIKNFEKNPDYVKVFEEAHVQVRN